MRLVIDARMLGYSGIGTYIANVLPGALRRCAALDPLLLALPDDVPRAAALAPGAAEALPWATRPLSMGEWRRPPAVAASALWWTPHFNVPLRSALPLVVTLHDLLPLNRAAGRQALHKRLAVRAWLAAIRRRALRVICDSESTRREAIELGGLDPARVGVIPLGVDAGWSVGAVPHTAATPPYIVFVGLVKPHKNLSGLLQAFEAVAARIPHRLVVVGRHRGLRDVDEGALASARRLAPRVELIQDVSQIRLAEIVSGADLLVQPSFFEGFGLPPLEAMAAGTPVIVSRAGAMPELCGDAALYCDPHSPDDIAQRILEALDDGALRARMRERGLARARLFTWDACARATADVLLAAFADASRRSGAA